MARTMSPSKEMTDGQIDKAVDAYRAMLRKHRSMLGLETVQSVLTQDAYLNEQVGVLRRRVEAASDIVWREAEVDRDRPPQKMLDATGRVQYTDRDVVETMPRSEGKKTRVGFFKLDLSEQGGRISDDELQKEYDLRNMKPDPYAQGQVNTDDSAFADEHSNAGHWQDANGKWCCIVFNRWGGGERRVRVRRHGSDWYGDWCFAGVSK
jgi:hypothetical protein